VFGVMTTGRRRPLSSTRHRSRKPSSASSVGATAGRGVESRPSRLHRLPAASWLDAELGAGSRIREPEPDPRISRIPHQCHSAQLAPQISRIVITHLSSTNAANSGARRAPPDIR
jgi:hypothetical protein